MHTTDIDEFTRFAVSSAMDSLQKVIETVEKLGSDQECKHTISGCINARMLLAELLLLNDITSAR